MNKYLAHFKTICKHKAAVFLHCRKCGIWWQGITHDLSKFSPTEFFTSAKYFQGDRSPIEAEKEAIGYSNAWLHHKGHNKHHWEYWCDFEKNGVPFPHRIPYKYIVEMICDWIGAGQVYDLDEWSTETPWNYYWGVRQDRHFHEDTEEFIVKFLKIIRDEGLDAFYYCARLGFSYLKERRK